MSHCWTVGYSNVGLKTGPKMSCFMKYLVFIWSALSRDYLFEKRIRKCVKSCVFGFRVLYSDGCWIEKLYTNFSTNYISADLKTDYSLSAVIWNLDFLKIGLWIVRKYVRATILLFRYSKSGLFCTDFRSHSNIWPFANQNCFQHSKFGYIQISDPHCLVSLNRMHLKFARTVAYNTQLNRLSIAGNFKITTIKFLLRKELLVWNELPLHFVWKSSLNFG